MKKKGKEDKKKRKKKTLAPWLRKKSNPKTHPPHSSLRNYFRSFPFISGCLQRHLSQLAPQIGAGPDAAVKVGEVEFFVRAVRVVVVEAPAKQQRIDAKLLMERAHDRDRAPFANEHRRRAERLLDARWAAAIAGLSSGTTTPDPPEYSISSIFSPGGSSPRNMRRSAAATFLGF